MPSINSALTKTFLFLTLLISVGIINVEAILNPTYLYHNCTNTTTFAPNSVYQSNLNTVLSSLSSNATSREFHNASTGGVYGLFLCRGDVNATACQDCVTFATKDVVKRCPVEKQAMLWYDECQLRYSNRSFFGTVDELPRISLLNTANVTQRDQDRFNHLLNITMKEAAAEAAKGGPGKKKFATREANFNGFQTLYNLAQCTPDLSSEDCGRCLTDAIGHLPICCAGKLGGRVLFPSCNVRYEFYPFYNQTAASPPSVTTTPPSPGSLASGKGKSKISTRTIVAIVVPIAVCFVIFILGFCFLSKRAKTKYNAVINKNAAGDDVASTIESLQFDLATIEAATNKFSADNKLVEGGFGEVYMGTLPNGQQIAVKRLSKSSGQGAEEFKNEVVLLAKLQHRNLVRLLGFCLEGEEKLLVYEFVPNKSLDNFLYEPEKQAQLDWSRRYKIIGGITRGMLYLHEDFQLRIIHRDLKLIKLEETQAELLEHKYAMHGQFSVKSDVYSFGVLILEIISGKKNNSFYEPDYAEDLLSYAWKLWKEGTPLKLLDPTLMHSYSENEVVRCIHIGLLCVQEDPEDRPTMKAIALMLNSYSVTLPVPERPAFYNRTEADMPEMQLKFNQSTSTAYPLSVNEASITELYPR